MSRGWTASSISVPTSAGVMPLGGSYMGATEMSGLGSRPLVHQQKNITTNAHNGSSTIMLLRRNHIASVSLLGWVSTPLGMYTSAVNPSRMESGSLVCTETVLPFTCTVASCSLEPYTPVKACARSSPAAFAGKLMLAEALSIGTGQSLPVTFQ